jgi:putative transposase
MKDLGQQYVQFVNRNYERTGSLWEGRFRSSIVDSETYLLRCHRYIEMNPVRAGMVEQPSQYRWSSYRTNAEGLPSAIVDPHAQYLALGESVALRRRAYAQLFETGLAPDELKEIRAAACGGFALGSADFVNNVEIALGKPARRRCAGRPRKGIETIPGQTTIIGI